MARYHWNRRELPQLPSGGSKRSQQNCLNSISRRYIITEGCKKHSYLSVGRVKTPVASCHEERIDRRLTRTRAYRAPKIYRTTRRLFSVLRVIPRLFFLPWWQIIRSVIFHVNEQRQLPRRTAHAPPGLSGRISPMRFGIRRRNASMQFRPETSNCDPRFFSFNRLFDVIEPILRRYGDSKRSPLTTGSMAREACQWDSLYVTTIETRENLMFGCSISNGEFSNGTNCTEETRENRLYLSEQSEDSIYFKRRNIN